MKKVLSGVIFSALISVPAMAADYKAPPPPAAPLYSWTGFYLGANIGAGWTNATTYTFADPGNAAFNSCGVCTLPYQPEALSDGRKSGLVGGLHLGFNWQFSPMLVAGVEGDFSEADLKKSVNAPLFSDAGPTTAIIPVAGSNLRFESDIRSMASIRGRLGVLVQNSWLAYATGGVAWADLAFTANAACPPPALTNGCVFAGTGTQAPLSQTTTRVGSVVGGGLEWQVFASPWRARVEYLYSRFRGTDNGSSIFVALPAGGPLACINTPNCSAMYTFGDVTVQTVRFGISYSFGSLSPIVARY